jgi:hypothetical protein
MNAGTPQPAGVTAPVPVMVMRDMGREILSFKL